MPEKDEAVLDCDVLDSMRVEIESELARAQLELFRLGDGGDDDSIALQLRRARLQQHICSTRALLAYDPKDAAKFEKLALDASTEQSRIKRNEMWDRINELEIKLEKRDELPTDLREL